MGLRLRFRLALERLRSVQVHAGANLPRGCGRDSDGALRHIAKRAAAEGFDDAPNAGDRTSLRRVACPEQESSGSGLTRPEGLMVGRMFRDANQVELQGAMVQL